MSKKKGDTKTSASSDRDVVVSPTQHRSNPIEEYLTSEAGKVTKFSELFKGNDEFIDQMSELSSDEVRLVNTLNMNDLFLQKNGIIKHSNVFEPYTHKHMRLMVSHKRKSREEYVKVHTAEEHKAKEGGGWGLFGRKQEVQP